MQLTYAGKAEMAFHVQCVCKAEERKFVYKVMQWVQRRACTASQVSVGRCVVGAVVTSKGGSYQRQS